MAINPNQPDTDACRTMDAPFSCLTPEQQRMVVPTYTTFDLEISPALHTNDQAFEDFMQDLELSSEDFWGDLHALFNVPTRQIMVLNGEF